MHSVTLVPNSAARLELCLIGVRTAIQKSLGVATVHRPPIGSRYARTPEEPHLDVIRRALVDAGVEFIDENGGGPGVRLRKTAKGKSRK